MLITRLRLVALAGLVAALAACSGGSPAPYARLQPKLVLE